MVYGVSFQGTQFAGSAAYQVKPKPTVATRFGSTETAALTLKKETASQILEWIKPGMLGAIGPKDPEAPLQQETIAFFMDEHNGQPAIAVYVEKGLLKTSYKFSPGAQEGTMGPLVSVQKGSKVGVPVALGSKIPPETPTAKHVQEVEALVEKARKFTHTRPGGE